MDVQTNTTTLQKFYRPELDGLRFVAFLLVFVHHLPVPPAWTNNLPLIGRLHYFGWAGVDIFLVLSSYLLTSLALREIAQTSTFNVGLFFKRRILRIWPLYYLSLFIGFFVYPIITYILFNDAFNFRNGIIYHLIPFSLFFGNFSYAAFTEYLGRYSSLWTINLEEQFYVVFPLITILCFLPRNPKRLTLIILGGLTIPILARTYFQCASIPYPWHWVSPITRFDPFVIGIAAATIDVKYRERTLFSACALVGAITVYALISSFDLMQFSLHNIWQLSASGLFGFFALYAARLYIIKNILSHKLISYLGKISFGLYVFHRYPLDIFFRYSYTVGINETTPFLWAAYYSLCLFLVVLISSISYHFFEKPFLRKKYQVEIIHSRPSG
jgi:peptidoglycan/LPS O-acetylase OafA/YrhL